MKSRSQLQNLPRLTWSLSVLGGIVVASSAYAQTAVPDSANVNNNSDGRKVVYTKGPDGRVVASVMAEEPDSLAFARFRSWMEKYAGADEARKTALHEEGLGLAMDRAQAMTELIVRNPKRAIELALRPDESAALPPAIAAQVEQWVYGRGGFRVLVTTEYVTPAGEPTVRNPSDPTQKVIRREKFIKTLRINDRSYAAHLYGNRNKLKTKNNLPFFGVALNGLIAVHESPVWALGRNAALPQGVTVQQNGTKCPVCGKDAAQGIAGVVGTTAYYFDTEEDLQKFTQQLWEAEQVIGPDQHG